MFMPRFHAVENKGVINFIKDNDIVIMIIGKNTVFYCNISEMESKCINNKSSLS